MSVLPQEIPVLKIFEDLSRIPRCSGYEGPFSDYLLDFAERNNLYAFRDDALNVIFKKPSAAGYEDSAPVILQAHMDMVCQKEESVDFDFETSPLNLCLEDGWLRAQGTTLGADDGYGVAIILGLLCDSEANHPALECVFTSGEEIGLLGAAVFDYTKLSGRRMIGLDSTGEVRTVDMLAGGFRLCGRKAVRLSSVPTNSVAFSLAVEGLTGGHSGAFIKDEKGNAIKLMARILNGVRKNSADCMITGLVCDGKDNAIPRECRVKIVCHAHATSAVEKGLEHTMNELKLEYEIQEPELRFAVEVVLPPDTAICADDSKDIIDFLYLLPNGVESMSSAVPGLVQTSSNIGVIRHDGQTILFDISLRSAIDSRIEDLARRIILLADRTGISVSEGARYPGMSSQGDSPFRQAYAAYMLQEWGVELQSVAAHAGGEGSYFSRGLPGLELVTVGPIMQGLHSPAERLNIDSFIKVEKLVRGFLSTLK